MCGEHRPIDAEKNVEHIENEEKVLVVEQPAPKHQFYKALEDERKEVNLEDVFAERTEQPRPPSCQQLAERHRHGDAHERRNQVCALPIEQGIENHQADKDERMLQPLPPTVAEEENAAEEKHHVMVEAQQVEIVVVVERRGVNKIYQYREHPENGHAHIAHA